MKDLRRLEIRVPEKHDLALMKVVRGLEHDLDAIPSFLALVERLFPDRAKDVAKTLGRRKRLARP